eukprot:11198673-Alexandrium_andersonii.AAC.1
MCIRDSRNGVLPLCSTTPPEDSGKSRRGVRTAAGGGGGKSERAERGVRRARLSLPGGVSPGVR